MPHLALYTATGLALLAIDLWIYIHGRHRTSAASRSAREFAAVSFAFFLTGSFALIDLSTQLWIHPKANAAPLLLICAAIGMALTTTIALVYHITSRKHL